MGLEIGIGSSNCTRYCSHNLIPISQCYFTQIQHTTSLLTIQIPVPPQIEPTMVLMQNQGPYHTMHCTANSMVSGHHSLRVHQVPHMHCRLSFLTVQPKH